MEQKLIPTESLEANNAFIIADSRFRGTTNDENPTNFSVRLNTALNNVRRISHTGMQWTQSFYTHTWKTSEIIISVSGTTQTTYYCYMPCFFVYTHFSGPGIDDEDFPTPVRGSYCDDLEKCFNNTMLLQSVKSGAGIFAATDPGDNAIFTAFEVRYSPRYGIRIRNTVQEFTIEDCDWLQAHWVHGFGVLDNNARKYVSSFRGNRLNLKYSNIVPLLCPTRYVTISSPELCVNRNIPTVHNTENPYLGTGELNIIQCTKDNISVPQTVINVEDPTVINLSGLSNVSYFKIVLTGEDGVILRSEYPSVIDNIQTFYADPYDTVSPLSTADRLLYLGALLVSSLYANLSSGDPYFQWARSQVLESPPTNLPNEIVHYLKISKIG